MSASQESHKLRKYPSEMSSNKQILTFQYRIWCPFIRNKTYTSIKNITYSLRNWTKLDRLVLQEGKFEIQPHRFQMCTENRLKPNFFFSPFRIVRELLERCWRNEIGWKFPDIHSSTIYQFNSKNTQKQLEKYLFDHMWYNTEFGGFIRPVARCTSSVDLFDHLQYMTLSSADSLKLLWFGRSTLNHYFLKFRQTVYIFQKNL